MAVQRSDNVLRHLYFKFVIREYVCFCLRMLVVQRIRVIPWFQFMRSISNWFIHYCYRNFQNIQPRKGKHFQSFNIIFAMIDFNKALFSIR